ncbi:TspO protein [Alsobacter soli]|uniref:TspO protein n=1 Tax=Alsobacter soli TaxID=2109933 RepID=A0A2T1HTE3_9HYPH|nr:TspO/MBR family protein [Alsobacter soli]PSC04878.1 TspO protein [Alsobacter soli]
MTTDIRARAPLNPLWAALLAVGAVALAAIIGNVATMPNIPTWYAGLAKPSFNPPNWVFGPVWGLLYLGMAFAFWRVLRIDAAAPGRGAAIAIFVVQLALNAFWSVAFFGMHNPPLGLVVVIALEIAILATIALFRRIDPVAGWVLLPYAAWVAFATVLNLSIVRLN